MVVIQVTRKKAKLETFPTTSCWFHVAALYGDLQDVDSVRAVVTHLTDCKNQTKMAIENESKSDWDKAFQYYRYNSYRLVTLMEH